VLTIGKLGTGRGQLEYYEQQVAAGIEDYYAGRGECGGVWRGSGLADLGLAAGQDVERRAFMALMQGLHPGERSVLRRMGACSKVAAVDLTFSAPKSVSVLFAIDDEHTSAALLEAHELAVDAALEYLEREACWTSRGHRGAEHLRGEGFIAASYRHRMSRAGDPQLHTHVVVANMTRAAGKYTARRSLAVRAQVGRRRLLPGSTARRGSGAVAVGSLARGRSRSVRDRRHPGSGAAALLAATG
jgi:conjugative relaxase-like TrwC/TraI family protein